MEPRRQKKKKKKFRKTQKSGFQMEHSDAMQWVLIFFLRVNSYFIFKLYVFFPVLYIPIKKRVRVRVRCSPLSKNKLPKNVLVLKY